MAHRSSENSRAPDRGLWKRRFPVAAVGILILLGFVGAWYLRMGNPSGAVAVASSLPVGTFFCRVDGALYRIIDVSSSTVRFDRLWPHNDAEVLALLRSIGAGGSGPIERRITRVGRYLVFVTAQKGSFKKGGLSASSYLEYPQILQPNRFGGYDRIDFEGPSGDFRKILPALIALEKRGIPVLPMRGTPVPEAWIPVDDSSFLDVLKQRDSNPVEANHLLQQLIARHPKNLFYPAIALDLAVLRQDQPQVVALLKRYENPLRESGHPYLSIVPNYYHEWLRAWDRSQRGENLWTVGQRLLPPADRAREILDVPAWLPSPYQAKFLSDLDLTQFVGSLQSARLTDTYFPLNRPLFFGNYKDATWIPFLVVAKCMGTLGDFRLFAGDSKGALQLDLPCLRIGIVMTRDSIPLVGKLIGDALRQNAVKYLSNVYLDGITNADQMRQMWPPLDQAYRSDLDSTRHRVLRDLVDPLFRTAPTGEFDHTEANTRDLVAHARLALLHTAAAARTHRMLNGSYPAGPLDFGPLLPGGPDRDPFTDFNAPLRIAHLSARPFVVYSLGPDREDQNASVEYDPTNGTISAGDLSLDVPVERTYPFPPLGRLAASRDEILAQFPHGLPPDRFAHHDSAGYAVTNTYPAWIVARGPHMKFTSQADHRPQEQSTDRPAPPYCGVSTWRGRYLLYPDLIPGAAYDPTNGTGSAGNLYFCTADPNATMLLHNLPPTPTPFPQNGR